MVAAVDTCEQVTSDGTYSEKWVLLIFSFFWPC